MPSLVAFASLPFALKEGPYRLGGDADPVIIHVSELSYRPFVSITSRPELAQSIPWRDLGDGFTSYTWYDHPFVLRVVFGRNVASLGSINSCGTIARPLSPREAAPDAPGYDAAHRAFCESALLALNELIASVRRKARLYRVGDLRREDIHVTVRADDGTILQEDPLQAALIREEEAQSESFDLLRETSEWYAELATTLLNDEPLGLADDLLTEAERALAQRFPRQAIATCHAAIEAATASLLTRGMSRRGRKDDEIDQVLSTKSLTAKLGPLMQTYTGLNLKRSNYALWTAFNALNDLRNDVVHRGGVPTDKDAETAIQTTRRALSWLAMVRLRNK